MKRAVIGALIVLPAALLSAEERRPPPDAGEGRCLECHGELAEGATVHGAVEMEMCDGCHSGGEGHRFELPEPLGEVCADCHDDPREEAEGHVHGPVAAGECVACHDPHRSPAASLLRQEPPDLCWSCHGKAIDRPDLGRTIRDVRGEIARAATVHGAVEEGCDACHPPHVASRQGLYNESFPAGPYAVGHEGSYELCFFCHDEEEILGEDPLITGFRDGERNLHRLHVARHKSRSCALCHSPHGGGDHLIRSSVLFGTWTMPLVYEATPEGGTCAPACHERRFYKNLVEAPAAGAAGESGPPR